MNYNKPHTIAAEFSATGCYKSDLPLYKFCILAILGGAFIAFGGLLSVMVAGGMPETAAGNPGLVRFVAGALFPVGLIMVALTGADLFTSDCTAFTLPWIEKKTTGRTFIIFLTVSFLFNFLGTQLIAYIFTAKAGLADSDPWKIYLHGLAQNKVDLDFLTVFIRGIGANWLVCLGMWMGFAAKDVTGKVIGIWVPVMIFVTLGYEHSIANMFFIPAAIYTGADITWGTFLLDNLIPATLGNIVGGAGLVGCVYGYLYLKK